MYSFRHCYIKLLEHIHTTELYAIGYNRSWYNQGRELFGQLLEYIEKNNYEICGDFYEEYPLNEICMGDNRNYLVRVMVPIRKKRGKKA
ncbi:MAG: hypothetical protein FWF18_04560, partial [Dehalococcoidia bacterium]|nr:hypothetical protein [Dehalococcoidia bacterium]